MTEKEATAAAAAAARAWLEESGYLEEKLQDLLDIDVEEEAALVLALVGAGIAGKEETARLVGDALFCGKENGAREVIFVVPADVDPGTKMRVKHDGREYEVMVPKNSEPGQKLKCMLAYNLHSVITVKSPASASAGMKLLVSAEGERYEVVIPEGAEAGGTFKVSIPTARMKRTKRTRNIISMI